MSNYTTDELKRQNTMDAIYNVLIKARERKAKDMFNKPAVNIEGIIKIKNEPTWKYTPKDLIDEIVGIFENLLDFEL
jgi:hypothetical protein